jgi:DNA-binding MarR family transcriptional regulator
VIGAQINASNFELLRWARTMAREHRLRPNEAHVLLLLATYANREAVAWPSLRTLALDAGYKPTDSGTCSTISSAIARLEDLGLVWTKQAGHGKAARRELLYRPPAAEPSETEEGTEPSAIQEATVEPSATEEAQPSANAEQKNQTNHQTANDQEEEPERWPPAPLDTVGAAIRDVVEGRTPTEIAV